MAVKRPAKLRVVLNPDDTRKLILSDGIPETMEQLMDEVRKVCGFNGNFRLQYQDRDFGDALVNLTSTVELEDLATVKVIPIIDDCSQGLNLTVCDDLSTQSDDTELLSTPSSSVSTRTQMWPREFPIPTFSYDTELQLEKGNVVYRSNMTRLTPSSKTKSDILEKVAEEIFKYKAYPTDSDFSDVAEALIKKHPCLSEPGSYNGCYGWKQRLKTKMGNYRTQLKGIGCSELLANSLKSKAPEDALPAKKVKRPKRGEANHIPDIPTGETPDKLEKERLLLLSEVMKRNNRALIKDKMAKTFSLRRHEIVEKELGVEDLKVRWPALFSMDEINAEFMRITTVPLQPRFLASLDKHHSKLIDIIRNKGGTVREKTRNILRVLDQSLEVNLKRECLLKSLIVYLGEDVDKLIKEYLVVQKDQAETELERCTMAVFVIREEEDPLQPPQDVGVVIEGVEVLNKLPSVTHACAMLFGLIYALNLSYPGELKYTFDALQKIFMEIEPKTIRRRVCSLSVKL
ncbi:uncharacterized protein LOC114553561 [Perca flavescens]|uniref:uncharacterized protein LOC114553561 n=1 Tax=Perca flavescens TaxID=8167 RepID=UPI00106E76C7|nr:uncharacterized protein LOC114553561 [Perca flavescens]